MSFFDEKSPNVHEKRTLAYKNKGILSVLKVSKSEVCTPGGPGIGAQTAQTQGNQINSVLKKTELNSPDLGPGWARLGARCALSGAPLEWARAIMLISRTFFAPILMAWEHKNRGNRGRVGWVS